MQRVDLGIKDVFGEQALEAWASPEFFAGAFSSGGILRLSIGRVSGDSAPMSWEDLMRVKRECGFGHLDAVEIYPADVDIFNTANLRHLYFSGPVPFALRHNTHVLPDSNTHELKD